MRAAGIGIAALMVVTFAAAPGGAQAPAAEKPAAEKKMAPKTFSGIKLVDLKARKPETTVTLSLGEDALTITDPASKSQVASLPYNGLSITHTVSPAPPAVAGEPATAATQPVAPPMYMGKDPRNWLTLKSGDHTHVLRVSEKVYGKLKESLQAHNVQVEEGK
jgi:hypothetical protein